MIDDMTKNIKTFLLSLMEQGISDFVISPGSRSTPVVLLLAELAKQREDIKLFIDVDERSASFFALGIAKKKHRPVAMICTSGTAATEYASAVAEAHLSKIPLLVITTDRPMELSNIGAPQAIDQKKLYGDNTKMFVNLDLQLPAKKVATYIAFESQRLVIEAQQQPSGPVQVNLPFRKPLMPTFETDNPTIHKIADLPTRQLLDISCLDEVSSKKTIIVAGPESQNYHQQLLQVAQDKNIPVVSDVLSNTRQQLGTTINNFDLITKTLTVDELSAIQPEMILRFGGTLVSANISKWLQKLSHKAKVVFVGHNQLNDHTLSADNYLPVDELDFLNQLSEVPMVNDADFAKSWQKLNNFTQQVKNELLLHSDTEMLLPKIIDQNVPHDSQIFLSNSMPIRDFENYYDGTAPRSILCNRGANGIDGVVSTALGTFTQTAHNYLLIGDLALFHDMNGLMMAKRYRIPVTIIVVNNNGGGIFSFLPQASAKDYFEQLFGTPQDLDFQKVASLYDFDYFRAETAHEVSDLLRKTAQQKIIEVKSDRMTNVSDHRILEQALQRRLREYV